MVVKRVIIVIAAICLSFTASAFSGYQSIASYVMPFVNREQVESGIELWLKQNPEYHNYDGSIDWRLKFQQYKEVNCEHYKYKFDNVRLDKLTEELKKNNYYLDAWKHKVYQIYDPLTSTYYSIMVLNGNGFLLAGYDVCVMGICFSDYYKSFDELSKAEIKEALSNFKKNILPQIKKYVRLAQKKE